MSVPGRMRDPEESWVKDRDKPFGTLISFAGTYFSPDSSFPAIDRLRVAVHRPVEDQNIDMRTFVKELEQALRGDTADLPEDALFNVTHYSDGTDDAFLRRIWAELFPERSVPGQE